MYQKLIDVILLGYVEQIGKVRNVYRILAGKRWVGNTEIDF
jgi:hypothetical protein